MTARPMAAMGALLFLSAAAGGVHAQASSMCEGYAQAAAWQGEREAVAAAPKNHKVLYETADLRVLEVTVQPGEREQAHHHRWPSVIVIDSRPPYVNYNKDGHEFKSAAQQQAPTELPLVVKLPAQAEHAIQNTGDKPFHAIRIEYKRLCEN